MLVDKYWNVILITTKTKAGNRVVRLNKRTIDVLKHYQASILHQFLKNGQKATGLVFTKDDLQLLHQFSKS
ncbi:hypothetical protein IV73_GL000966 [Weissella kandleri]|uniref:Uncharacterized protein n=1 Tax=Weissella kandleri TaxID=1616 RepID=A0A0R2JMA0_9LACO|nr:hypothetical protein IV73_GL000966 [Weissella kandleri]